MSQVDQALETIAYYGRLLLGLLLGAFGMVEQFCRQLLGQAGVPPGLQTLIILAVAVLFIVAVLRLFGGFFRVVLVVVLILLVLHVLVPNAGL